MLPFLSHSSLLIGWNPKVLIPFCEYCFLQQEPHIWMPNELTPTERRGEILINTGTRNWQRPAVQLQSAIGNHAIDLLSRRIHRTSRLHVLTQHSCRMLKIKQQETIATLEMCQRKRTREVRFQQNSKEIGDSRYRMYQAWDNEPDLPTKPLSDLPS